MSEVKCATCQGGGKALHVETGEPTKYPCPDCLCPDCGANTYPLGAEKCEACGWSWRQS